MNRSKYFLYGVVWLVVNGIATTLFAQVPKSSRTNPVIVSRIVSAETPHFYNSLYVTREGFRLRSGDFVSNDNGKTWNESPMKPDFTSNLPKGYRRNPVTSVLDTKTGRIISIFNALDVKDLDSAIDEPPIAQKTYYLRYRVSEDSGRT